MTRQSPIEIADRRSHLRAVLFGWATIFFLFVQVLTRPAFTGGAYSHGWRLYAWAFNVALLLACLGTGGGLFNSTQIRALINDEVAQSNYRTSCKVGFWVAMFVGLGMFVVPALAALTGRQVIYVVVTLSSATALLTFSWLEYRSHADR